MTAADATRLAGDSYSTRLARDLPSTSVDKTRIAQDGYQSKLARDVADALHDASEFYKVGDKIGGRYEVAAIHHGAMGVVYGCLDHETKLPRALKTVRARYAHDKQVLSMFEAEAAVWISLEKHPYIVRAYLVKRFKNLPYVITEYVRGPEGMEGDLRGWLGHPRLTLSVAVTMALQIAQGMQHAVRKVPSLVHRDLKPANILVNGDGKAMVTDFGLVQVAQSGAGTPAYMSPEQWRGDTLDARSDIYAYGCILFEMFTAHRLFPALTEREWERAHVATVPVNLTRLAPRLPDEIDRFVLRCLAKDVVDRPQSWDEIINLFANWYHQLTGNSVVLDFSSLALDAAELFTASCSFGRLKRFEEMLFTCERGLAIYPNSIDVLNSKGLALRFLNRSEDAVQTYDLALALNQSSATAWRGRGCALLNINRYEEAVLAFDRALEIGPNDGDVLMNKGIALKHLKRNLEAIQAYDQALAINPQDVGAWINRGASLIFLARYEEAVQAYDRVLTLKPDDAHAWFEKGNALLRLERYEAALLAFDHASSLDTLGGVSFLRGFTLQRLQRYEESITACDCALAVNPALSIAQSTKSFSLQKLNREKSALQVRRPQSFWERLWRK